jgi:hypothetical protein
LSAAKVVDAVRPMAFNERDGRAIGNNSKAIEVSPKCAEAYLIRSRVRGPCTHGAVSDYDAMGSACDVRVFDLLRNPTTTANVCVRTKVGVRLLSWP